MTPATALSCEIKSRVGMKELIEYYGFRVTRGGFISCPFHSEKDASLKVYKNSWHCYGCGEGTSVIDFVMKYFKLNFSQAVTRIDNDFNLNITGQKLDARTIERLKADKVRKEKTQLVEELIKEYWTLEFKKHYLNFCDLKPKEKFEELHDDFVEALRYMPQIEERIMGEVRACKR